MKLTAKTDLDVPAAQVYAAVLDHAAWEREAVRRGVEIERPVDRPASGVGAGWRVRARLRGKERRFLITVEELSPGTRAVYGVEGPSIKCAAVLEIMALSPRRSRLRVSLDVKPKTLAARLFLNTLRLTKGRVQARLETRLGQLGLRITERYQRNRVEEARP